MRIKNHLRMMVVVLWLAAATAFAADTVSSFRVLVEEQASGFRFSVQAENATSVQVEVFGLDGRHLFDSGWVADKTVTWPLMTPTSRAANGVYLYAVSVRDRHGREQHKLGKLILVYGQESVWSGATVGDLAGTEPSAAQFPLTPGTSWTQRLGTDRSDTYRILRRPPRLPGGLVTSFEQLLQLGANGKLHIKELCLGAAFEPVTVQLPDGLTDVGDCRSSWSAGSGGTTTPSGWTDDGAIVRLANATDKVGIGTTNPTELLTVAGNIDATGQKSKIRFQFDTLADLPSATTYHGMFAHVHATGKAYFAHAGQWVALANEGGVSGWSLTGNAGLNAGTNFLGTTSNAALVFRTNNLERMRLSENGSIVIGTNAPCVGARLQVTQVASGIACAIDLADIAIFAENKDGSAVVGHSANDVGIAGISIRGTGVFGLNKNGGTGVQGVGGMAGVTGFSNSGDGVIGSGAQSGVSGDSESGTGVSGSSTSGFGVYGFSSTGIGVYANTNTGNAIYAVLQTPASCVSSASDCNLFLGIADGNQARIDKTGKGFFNGGTANSGADFAESMRTTDHRATLQPGDVLVIDPQQPRAVKKSTTANSPLVAGVYSTRPSVLSIADHKIDDSLEGEVPVAVVGIVPTKVTSENGPIRIGDLLVSSSTPGHAMRAPDNPRPGTIVGKALENLNSNSGVIEVLVILR